MQNKERTIEQLKAIIASNDKSVPEKDGAIKVLVDRLKSQKLDSSSKGKISKSLKSFIRDDSEIPVGIRALVAKKYFRLAYEGFSDAREDVLKRSKLGASGFPEYSSDDSMRVTLEALRVTFMLARGRYDDARQIILNDDDARKIILKYTKPDVVADCHPLLVMEALRATCYLAQQGDDEALLVILRYSDPNSEYCPANDDIQVLSIELLGELAKQRIPQAVSVLRKLHNRYAYEELSYLSQSVKLAIVASHRVLLQTA